MPVCVLSIIIVTYNSGEIIDACLNSLATGAERLEIEVIVVDNNSQDGTPERIAHHHPHVKIIRNTHNLGFAAANNQGLAAAMGDPLLLLNPDVIVHPGALTRMVEALGRDPTIGIVGPRTFDIRGQVAVSMYPSYSVLLILWQFCGLDRLFPDRVYGRYRRAAASVTEPFEVAWVQASCLMFSRAVYNTIGGLDDHLFLFAEDPDFCDRARQAGWRVMFVPSAEIDHMESSTVSRYPLLKMRHYHISPLYYFRKRGKHRAVLVLKLGFTVELAVKWIIRGIQLLGYRDPARVARFQAYPRVIREIWRY